MSILLPKALNLSLNLKGFLSIDLNPIWVIKDHLDRKKIAKIG